MPARSPVQYVGLGLIAAASLLALNRLTDHADQQRHETALRRMRGKPGDLLHVPGLHNVLRVSDKLYSGSSPEGDASFQSLQKLGVRTIVSVDGARPDAEAARRFGMRYVHLPLGYDGVSAERVLQLAKAANELPGPIYLHCHHGKHRGPTAAAVALLASEPECSAADAVAFMKKAGTDPRYRGLYQAVRLLRRPPRFELGQVELPETATVGALTELMVQIDERWENLRRSQSANGKTRPPYPDLDSAHEALQLAELYREAARTADASQWADPFLAWLVDAERDAVQLETSLRRSETLAATEHLRRAGQACIRCHAKFRDAPR
jgi:protein tyrosine phosphatase (PTP) superfamily phosphohydrolase (DUF442 family)